jgi:hypothetical protein
MDPPRSLEFCSRRGLSHCGRWELESRDGSTVVRFRLQFQLRGVEAMALRAIGVHQFLERHVQESIQGLKRALENGA